MTVEQMRKKLLEWNPSWVLENFTDQQIAAIYAKERNKIVQSILRMYPEAYSQ